MTTEENVHGEVSDIFEDRQEVEDEFDVENVDDQPEFGSYYNADSHATGKEEVLLDNGDGKNDADGPYVFVSGSEAFATDDDSGGSDLNVVDSHKMSNSGENIPCISVYSNDTFVAREGLQGELSSGESGENNYPAKHDKFDGQRFDIEHEVDEHIEVQPFPESRVVVSKAAECECQRQQLFNTAKDCTDGSVVSAGLVEEIWEIIVNNTMSPGSIHDVDRKNVGRQSESASDESHELKNVVLAVEEKELSEYVENVRQENGSVSITNVKEYKKFNNLVGADIQNSPRKENGAITYSENVGLGTESVSVPDLRESQELKNIARADSQNNLANKKDLGEYVDEIAIDGKQGGGPERLEEDSKQDLTADSCLVTGIKIGTIIINGTVSNEDRDCLVTDYIQDRVSTTVDSNRIAGDHNIPFENNESDLGSADSSQDISQQSGSIESSKTSPAPLPGENACSPSKYKIQSFKSSLVYDTELNIEPDYCLLMDKPTFPSDHAITNSGISSINNASGGNLDSDAEIEVESHANSLIENGSYLSTCSGEDDKLVPETEKLSALSSTDTTGDSNVIPNKKTDAVDSEGTAFVEKEEDQFRNFDGTQEVKVASDIHGDENSKPTQEGSTVILDGQNMGVEVGKKSFFFLIRLPRYDDDGNMKEQIKHVQFQVDDKTKRRDTIRAEIQIQRGICKECGQDVEAAISAERVIRDLLKSKRQEMDSVQSIINQLNNAISVEDIDGRIRNIEHMIEHETLPLKEEKHLLRQIKQLKQHREELSSNMGKQDQLRQSLNHKDSIEEHFKNLQHLRKEVESLRQNVLNVEAVTKAAKKNYHNEYNKLSELLAQFKAADAIRQEAYSNLQTLKIQLYEKNKNFWDYKNAVNKASELAAEGKREELQCFCVNQVESIMQLWNKNDEFRREYVRCNTRSTLRRLRTLDGRSFGPDEEPPVIPKDFNDRDSKISSLSRSTPEQENKAAVSAETVNLEDKRALKVLAQRSQPIKTKKPAKPPLVDNSLVMISSWDEAEDLRQEPMRMNGEQELILKAKEVRKEEEAATLKEKRRQEEMAKAKEALLRKKRNADKAQKRAALRAQKEAEQKEKEREKKARKKERSKASAMETVDNTGGGSAPSSEALTSVTEDCDHSEKSVEVTKRLQKASQFMKPTKAKSIPPPLRNRGKRRMQSYMWVLITSLVVVSLFFLGNRSFFLRSGLHA